MNNRSDHLKNSLSQYLETYAPFGKAEISKIELLRDDQSSNHLNYKICTSLGNFAARVTQPDNLLSYANLADEFTLLKLIERHDIAPRAVAIDLENFVAPVLFEEYLEGESVARVSTGTEEMFEAALSLLATTSDIELGPEAYPFKFGYSTYETNYRAWDMRMKEIVSSLGNEHFLVDAFGAITKQARRELKKTDPLLRSSLKEFIYNDVHPGNMFWLGNKMKFIDWQKASLGDPAFMLALFVARFAHIWNMEERTFAQKALSSYRRNKTIPNFEALFFARILERAVSDALWVTWADIKKGIPVTIKDKSAHAHLMRAENILSHRI